MYELTQKILQINPDAMFSVHELDSPFIDENEEQFIRSGYRVSWNSRNEKNCPTQADIDKIILEA